MTLPLTPEMLRAAYDYLNTTPPFRNWNLPEGDDVEFKVVDDGKIHGWYRKRKEQHVVAISRRSVGHTKTLIETMAHEMIHVHEGHTGILRPGRHSAAFRKWAKQICKHHGFDPKAFA